MLSVPAPFPFPGSLARVDGLNWRVHQHNADGTATLMRGAGEGAIDGTSTTRRHPITDLVDPCVDRLPIEGLGRIGIAQIAWLDERLRFANVVIFSSLLTDMIAAARSGAVPIIDSPALVGLLRRLGWERQPRTGTSSNNAHSIWERTRAPNSVTQQVAA